MRTRTFERNALRSLRRACLLAWAIGALACSDGAAPSAYRAPLDDGTGGASRCDAPGDCFESCFCSGGTMEACVAACGESPPTQGGGAPAPQGGEEPTPQGGEPAGEPAPMACTPPLPPTTGAEFLCDPGGPGACQNCGDCAQIIDGSAKQAAKDCGIQCGGSKECAASCIRTNTTLSAGCSGCLVDFFDCLIANCLAECIGVDPAACTACTQAKPSPGASCSDALTQCSGAERNPAFSG